MQKDYTRLKMIVCVGENNLIGDKVPSGNGLLWHSKEELLYYKSITTGQVTFFGENTAKFVPIDWMKKTREVLVLTMDSNIDEILKQYPEKDVFLCGGATIYQYYLEHYPIAQVYLSKLKAHVAVGEAKILCIFQTWRNWDMKLSKRRNMKILLPISMKKRKNSKKSEGEWKDDKRDNSRE